MSLTRRTTLAAAAGASALAALRPGRTRAAPPPGRQAPGFYRLAVGDALVTAVNDGIVNLGVGLFPDAPAEEAGRLLANAFLPTNAAPTAVNAFAIDLGGRLTLVDTGGRGLAPGLGGLAANLAAAGIEPSAVDAVLLTHMHPDHVNGLLTAEGAAAFPNAELVVDAAEHRFWTDEAAASRAPEATRPAFEAARRAAAPYADRLRPITPGGEVAPGVTALAAPGHTPGHTMYAVASGGAGLLIWGDVVHVAALQVVRPDWSIAFDSDPARAAETRKRVFERAAADRLAVAGMHLGFPGVGHVARAGDGYAYVPEPWRPLP